MNANSVINKNLIHVLKKEETALIFVLCIVFRKLSCSRSFSSSFLHSLLLPAEFSREFFMEGGVMWRHEIFIGRRRVYAPSMQSGAWRVHQSQLTFWLHPARSGAKSFQLCGLAAAERPVLRFLRYLKGFSRYNIWRANIMATDVVDNQEMREAQRDYLDFLDDDVSLTFSHVNCVMEVQWGTMRS